jgi:uncharacterized protein YdbL (DUF1318 family)/uncharacterized protein YukE
MSTYVVDYVQPIVQPMDSLQGHFTQLVAIHREANAQLRSQTQDLVSSGTSETFQGEGAKSYSDLVNYYLTNSEKHLQVLEDASNTIKTSHGTIMDATYSASSANLHDGLTNKVLTQVTHDQIIQQGSEPIWAVVNEMLSTLNDMKNTAGSFFGDLVSFHFGDALGALGREFSDAGQLVGEITSLLQDIGRVLGQWASEVCNAVGQCLRFLGGAIVGLLDFVTGFSSMVNDIKTLFNGKASLLDKLLAAGDLVLNAGMDILMVTGIGEGLRAGELAIKAGIEIAKGFGRDAIEQGVKDVAEQGLRDAEEQGAKDLTEQWTKDAVEQREQTQLQDLKTRLSQIDGLQPDEWKNLNPDQRAEVLQNVHNQIAEAYGFQSGQVTAVALEEGDMGGFMPDTKGIELNSNLVADNNNVDALETIAHESRHAYQEHLVSQDPATLSEADREIAQQWSENMAPGNYIRPEQDFEGYFNQPIEADAEGWATEIFMGLLGDA